MMNRGWAGLIVVSSLSWGCVVPPADEGDGAEDGTPVTTSETGLPPGESDADGPGDGPAQTTGGPSEGTTTDGGESTGPVMPPPIKLDVGTMPDGGGSACAAPPQVTCDNMDDDPWHALGLNCPGGPQVDGSINLTGPEQLYVHSGNLGTFMPAPFPPREGDKMVILSSGAAQDLTVGGLYASTSVGFGGTPLPPPIQTGTVSAMQDCIDNPALVGTGDCSNTIQDQWDQGSGSNDYAEMRFTVEVPAGTFGFTYDLAMFSTEYPAYYQSSFNDMYIAWLESELWTGNISFDEMGHPISLNAGFLDYKDAPNPVDCPAPCAAPELQGTAMEGHAGTRWLTTTAGVTPGETIEVIFGVFDLTDTILDTVVILDNFAWACEGGGPVTIPG